MEPPASSGVAVAAAGSGDEWELINDDGFVYKRKKRQIADPKTPLLKPAFNPEEEEKQRRERKRKTLLKLIEQCSSEIAQWVLLSNTLSSMQNKAQSLRIQEEQRREGLEALGTGEKVSSSGASAGAEDEGCSGSLVDELLSQVEAQEEIIHEVSNLCDVVEAMCETQEKRAKETYFELPIWASPGELMSALCD